MIIPGEFRIGKEDIKLNFGRERMIITVINDSDRPVQVGSHFHFYEVNRALKFNRDVIFGFRLDIPSGMSIRFEPGQSRNVKLVKYSGECKNL